MVSEAQQRSVPLSWVEKEQPKKKDNSFDRVIWCISMMPLRSYAAEFQLGEEILYVFSVGLAAD